MYPKIYHAAMHHLINHSSYEGDRARGRLLVAKALRAIRRQFGRDRAMRERYHMKQICGQFPVKDKDWF